MTEFGVCETPGILRVIYFIKIIINIVKTIVPIGLIIMVTIDCAKGVISGDNKVGNILKVNMNRILSAILIFTVPTIVNVVLEIIDENTSYESCWVNAESSIIEKYQLLWDAEEERKKQEEESQRQEEQLKNSYFSEKITYSYEYVNNGSYIPYALYTPSTAQNSDSVPLIVWLHGYGDGSASQKTIETRGLPRAISEWGLDNFNAYVICPQIINKTSMAWFSTSGKSSVDKIVTMMIENYNIDTSKIIIAGHSNGGVGALYIAATDTNNYYSTVVSVSGNNPRVSLSHLSSLRGRAYVGTISDTANYNYAYSTLQNIFGKDNIFKVECNHGEVSWKAFLLDEDNNNKSDLIEWMLQETESNNNN